MVENSANSKGQMPGLTPEGLSMVLPGSPSFSPHHAGVKLEAVMEQLQRQQQARLEMEQRERNERHVREAHIRYTQQVAAQQAVLAAARASGNQLPSGLLHRGLSALVVGGQRASDQSSVNSEADEERARGSGDEEEEEEEEEMERDEELEEGSEEEEGSGGGAVGLEYLRKQTLALQMAHRLLPATHPSPPGPPPPIVEVKQEPDEESHSPGEQTSGSPSGQPDWGYDEQFKQNGSLAWSDEADGGRGRGGGEASRDFAKGRWDSSVLDKKSNDFDREGQKMLYELDGDPKRKEFLDDLFTFMQKRGTPVNRIPIMAKQVLDLYTLYKLVTEKGGLVEVINKKIWREITKGLNLPTSITSAAFTLRTQYMKYLYPYECEKKGLSSPVELQAAIDSNRREGRRPSYTSTLFGYSPTPSGAPHILSPPKMHLPNNGLHLSPGQPMKKDGMSATLLSSRLPMAMALGNQQMSGLARAATLEQLREKLETGEPPERKMARVAEEQQRFIQHAFQQNLLAMATQMPMNIRINNREDKQDMALSISASGTHSISMSVEVNGTVYSGVLFAQKPAAAAPGPSGGFGILSSSHSPTSSKAPSSAEPSTSGSP
ncbi:AT-rich interactive domain-containing protein 3B-like isoform X2 [Acipenser ruthenus]|uniref:AT-rich interactive domain-containing protein 3B-like isoform X2 n=1 Tax=Acipenser ruthenus TaxID=7906 RepID=UPI002741D691|nr:AT-rich interactive domain-containing protein 3B-like isoform X2 [Acipenser ruthenus]